jgi:hypothetical protein
MFREYAVEPEAVGSSWQTCRYVIEKFGFDRGRLISEFPKGWLKEVYDVTLSLQPVERKRVEETLRSAKRRLIRRARPYDRADDWLLNALREHKRSAFHGIIVRDNASSNADLLVADELAENAPGLMLARSAAVPRDASSIASALSMLLAHGSRLAFVDPFFDLFDQKYKKPLKECLQIAKTQNSIVECEIHYRYHEDNVEPSHIEKNAVVFCGLIPQGMKLKIHCWRQKVGGEDFHARYFLTDRGGLGVDAGFSEEGKAETTDMHILDLDLCQKRLAAFTPPADIYELIGPVLLIDAQGKVSHA